MCIRDTVSHVQAHIDEYTERQNVANDSPCPFLLLADHARFGGAGSRVKNLTSIENGDCLRLKTAQRQETIMDEAVDEMLHS